jgi:hypothetical protein
VPGQKQAPATPAGNDLNLVTFPAVTTSQLRVTMTDRSGDCSGVTELEAGGTEQPGARLWINGATATSVTLNQGQASTVTTAYSPAAYTSQLDDQFSSAADLGNYTQLQSSVTTGTGEVAPAWSVGGGLASATAAQPWFGFLVSGTAPASASSTAVVQVQALDSGAVNHNDPATRARYHFAFGLRGDGGAMRLRRFQAGSAGS